MRADAHRKYRSPQGRERLENFFKQGLEKDVSLTIPRSLSFAHFPSLHSLALMLAFDACLYPLLTPRRGSDGQGWDLTRFDLNDECLAMEWKPPDSVAAAAATVLSMPLNYARNLGSRMFGN
jgi:hypothetical protein